jgi:hypothetical protein
VRNEGTYIVGDVLVSITGNEDYRELGVDSEHILDELRTGYERHGEISNEKSDLGGIRYVVLLRLCGIVKRYMLAPMAFHRVSDHFFIVHNKDDIFIIADSLCHGRSIP